MNKLKSAIAKLRDYLGKDTSGISLLNDVKNIADAQRKQLAAERDRCKSLQARADAAIQEHKKLAWELAEAQSKLRRSHDELRQAQQHAARLQNEATKPETVCTGLHEASLRSLAKNIAKRGVLPKPHSYAPLNSKYEFLCGTDKMPVWERESLMSDWSNTDLFTFGGCVALASCVFGGVMIYSVNKVKDMDINGDALSRQLVILMNQAFEWRTVACFGSVNVELESASEAARRSTNCRMSVNRPE